MSSRHPFRAVTFQNPVNAAITYRPGHGILLTPPNYCAIYADFETPRDLGRMTPFHFGDRERQLLGVYHPAGQAASQVPAVVLCNPFGEEAIRAHRFMRVLAERLARGGSAVLRFDYFGAGDSGGADEDVCLSGMSEDVLAAHEELLDMSGAARVVWVGLGLGASAAAQQAASRPRGLAGLVLWDPVIIGADYLRALSEAHIAYLSGAFDEPPETIIRRFGAPTPEPSEVMGFAISDAMKAELCALDLSAEEKRLARSVMVVTSSDAGADQAFRTAIEESRAKLNWARDDDASSWNSDQAMNEYFIPTKTIDMIVAAVGGWR